MKNRGTTYALLSLFFAGLVGLWVADSSRIPTRLDRERIQDRVLVNLIDARPDDLRKLEILGGEEPIVFERRDGNRWEMTRPLQVDADPSKVEGLAYTLKELRRKPETAPITGDAGTHGLAPPERTIRLWGPSEGEPLATLEVSAATVDRRYVRAQGSDQIQAVDARGFEAISLPVDLWRDRELFRVPSFEVDGVTLASPGRTLKFHRDADSWRIVEPIHALATDARVEGLVADLGSLRVTDRARFIANDVAEADLEKYGLKTPALTVTIDAGRAGRARPSRTIQVGKAVDGQPNLVYVKREGQNDVLAVESRIFKTMAFDPSSYRSPKVADFAPGRVEKIRVEADGKPFELARLGNDWWIDGTPPVHADKQAVLALIRGLDGLQTSIYLQPEAAASTGVDKPGLIIKLWHAPDRRELAATRETKEPPAERKPDFILYCGRRDAAKKTVFARTEGDRTILALPETSVEFLPGNSLAFRERMVASVAPERIERIRIVGGGQTRVLNPPVIRAEPKSRLGAFASLSSGWWMTEPVVAPADATAIERMLKLLAPLRAEAMAADAPSDLERFGLKPPTVTLTWSTMPDSERTPAAPRAKVGTKLDDTTLEIGASVPGKPRSRFARMAGQPLVFTLASDQFEAVDAEFHDRAILLFDPKHARRIQLAWPDRGFSLANTGGGAWTLEGAVDAPDFDPSRAPSLLETLNSTIAIRFVQYDGEIRDKVGLNPPRLAVRVEFDDATPPKTFRLGALASDDRAYATNVDGATGPVFLVAGSTLAGWVKPPRRRGDLPENVFAPE